MPAQGDLAAYGEGLEVRRRLASADPSHAEHRRDMSVSVEKRGRLKAVEGARPERRRAGSPPPPCRHGPPPPSRATGEDWPERACRTLQKAYGEAGWAGLRAGAVAHVRDLHARELLPKGGGVDSVDLIREMREERERQSSRR
jgi:hypothetical protein